MVRLDCKFSFQKHVLKSEYTMPEVTFLILEVQAIFKLTL